VASGLLGAGVLTLVLLATGTIGGSTTVTALQPVGSGAPVANTALHPAALYADVAPGVVDITASSPQQTASGSGVVLDGSGNILTADHVIQGAGSVSVRFSDGTTRSARVLGGDPSVDLAVLRVDPAGLTLHPLPLGDTGALRVGDPVAAVGDPFGYQRSLSTGIVSGLDRTIPALNGYSVGHAIQTDAVIDPGNSGGPLLNAHGQVVGIVDQIATGNSGADQSSGVGFAISSSVVKAELGALERGTSPSHAYLGVQTVPATLTSGQSGALVQTIQAGGPAARGGMRAGDIIEAIDGHTLRGGDDLIASLAADRPGQSVALGILRGSRQLTLRATLATRPRAAAAG
jgi:putative serine protease PepD